MKCLLAAASPREIAPFLAQFRAQPDLLEGLELDILITGIGLLSSTWSLQRQVMLKRPALIIQAGVAGSFDRMLPLGTVLTVKKDTVADQGVIESGELKTIFDMGFLRSNTFPYKKAWLSNPGNPWLKRKGRKLVSAITVNQVSSSAGIIKKYQDYFHPTLETMEGAALHYIGLQENIPFIQLRAISNYVGERNKKKWKLSESINELNNDLVGLLKSLSL